MGRDKQEAFRDAYTEGFSDGFRNGFTSGFDLAMEQAMLILSDVAGLDDMADMMKDGGDDEPHAEEGTRGTEIGL